MIDARNQVQDERVVRGRRTDRLGGRRHQRLAGGGFQLSDGGVQHFLEALPLRHGADRLRGDALAVGR